MPLGPPLPPVLLVSHTDSQFTWDLSTTPQNSGSAHYSPLQVYTHSPIFCYPLCGFHLDASFTTRYCAVPSALGLGFYLGSPLGPGVHRTLDLAHLQDRLQHRDSPFTGTGPVLHCTTTYTFPRLTHHSLRFICTRTSLSFCLALSFCTLRNLFYLPRTGFTHCCSYWVALHHCLTHGSYAAPHCTLPLSLCTAFTCLVPHTALPAGSLVGSFTSFFWDGCTFTWDAALGYTAGSDSYRFTPPYTPRSTPRTTYTIQFWDHTTATYWDTRGFYRFTFTWGFHQPGSHTGITFGSVALLDLDAFSHCWVPLLTCTLGGVLFVVDSVSLT